MQLTTEQATALGKNLTSFIAANELTLIDAARRMKLSKAQTAKIRNGKGGPRMTNGTGKKLAQGMARTFLELTSAEITDWKRNTELMRAARNGKKKAGKKKKKVTKTKREPMQSFAETVDAAVVIGVDGVIHPRKPAQVWPYDKNGTTAVKVGRVLVLVSLQG